MSRIAIIDREKCVNGKRCSFICGKYCPVNRSGADCIIINDKDNKPVIDEDLCVGCKICAHRCPVKCISIVNLPEKLNENPIHRFGNNMFELFRLPLPKKDTIIGLLGRNGIGKSTALNILSGLLKPNLGNFKQPPTDDLIIEHYSKTVLANYFKDLYNNKIKLAYKPQRIDMLPKLYKGKVSELLSKVDEKGIVNDLVKELDIQALTNRKLNQLSGGELQKLTIIATIAKNADVYYFDEPASFLDVTTRIKVAKLIRSLKQEHASVIVVEHDLATLDYISDELQIIYGEQGAYGVVSQSKSVRRGINEYLDGYLPDDNVRFRSYPIRFFQYAGERQVSKDVLLTFPVFEKSFNSFKLKTAEGVVHKGEVMAVMGANGLGKSTFLNILAGMLKPDSGKIDKLNIAYKVQYPSSNVNGTVQEILTKYAKDKFTSGWFRQNILEKLSLSKILDNEVKSLSGGELQKLYIALTLSQDCEIYALDEPSAFIDVEDRLTVAQVIKDFVIKNEVSAIVVDHDVQFIDYIGDSMLVFEGKPGSEGNVYGPLIKTEGMNRVLKMLDITYRMDKETKRPRINKPGSQLDQQQRSKGEYYYH